MANPLSRLTAALADRYTIERELGGGGMSRVWLATETALDRQVVIKVIAAELSEGASAERFAREVRLAARLQQANIVPVLHTGTAAGLPYYTMPYVRGESLRARMTGGAPLTLSESVSILRDVARALAYAHGEGIVHRDIKPENVLLSHGTAMVTDFGIAKALTALRTLGSDTAITLTQAGGSIGTPAYMAPEQAVGDAVDYRTDLYAWGIMAYELLTGAHPFGRHVTPQQLVTAHLTETPAPLIGKHGTLPPALAALVLQCLEKDPARRPASAAAVLAALDTAATPVPSSGTLAARGPRFRKTELLLAAGVIALAAIVWALVEARGTRAPIPAGEQSIAVLPLANLSGDKADDYFGIGLAEEITRAVAKNGVRVIGRVSAGALQAKGLDDRAIAKELGVGSLLTGTVQRAGDQIRINVTLVSASDGAVRWTEKYDRPLANVFAVQDEIARTVATTLLGSLGGRPRALARAETADPEAHALFLQGQVLFNRRGPGNLHQAIALFQQATARDPKYARAQASLAMALAVLPAYVLDSTPEILSSAVPAAERAIAMDSTIPEPYAALGYAYSLLGKLGKAEDNFRRALSYDSTMATTWGWYGLLAGRLGEYQAAHERIARSRALEPASMIARIWDVQILVPEHRSAEADSLASSTIAMDSTFMLAWSWRANALLERGQAAQAVAVLERYVSMLPSDRPEEAHCLLAYAYAKAGRVGDARAMLDRIRAKSGGRFPAVGAIAAALEELGEHEAAVTLLGQAIARSDTWTVQFPHLARYNQLRKDPRAAVMLAKLGAR
jgi:TolB-like protein/tetratricopeptide (TPR) repeat protein/tRNA A-37 threonylcarbamoyl transferase component Bud32